MAFDKVIDSTRLDADIGMIADAIRLKTGEDTPLAFPDAMVQAISEIITCAVIDYFQYATHCNELFSLAQIPDSITLVLPNAINLKNMFNEAIGGNIIDLTLNNSVSDLSYFMNHQNNDRLSTVTKLILRGDLSDVTTYQRFARYCSSLIEVDADIDFSSVTNSSYIGYMFYTASTTPLKVRFVPNTLSLNVSTQVINSRVLDDNSLVSFCNCLTARNGTVALSSENKRRCASLPGTVSQCTDDTGTYDFFTADASGNVTLENFVTQTKGWTIA